MTFKFSKLVFGALFLALFGGFSQAQTVVFEDQFNSAAWDSAKWNTYGTTTYLQRTQFGNAPAIASESGVSFARLRLDSYNPDPAYSGNYLRGTEILTKTLFSPGEGLEIETRLRGKDLPRGIVFAFFTYGERGAYPNNLRDEIDYEFLTNFDKDKIWLNIWDEYNKQSGTGANQSSITAAPGLDRTTWHTYKIRWTKTRVDWYVDNVIVRTSTDILPADPMSVRFNIWAGASSWPTAYDENLPVTAVAAENQSFYLDVDWVQVRTLPDASVGSGTGLTGTYFNNKDFTGTSIQRLDPQVNFQWGYEAPTSQIDADTYSVRWTGQVQPQFTENYTFTARTDDGVRLWVNNQLIIDKWQNGSPEDYSGQINLVAGQKYDIKMEYYEDAGGAAAQLFWSSLNTTKALIPQSQLYPTTAPPANTAPTIAISSPVNGRLYEAAPLFAGAARDAETSIMALNGLLFDQARNRYWNGTAWTTTAVNFPISTPNGDWSYQLPPLLDGRFTLRLAAVDTTRKSSSSALTFSINNKKPPVIVINSPVNGRIYTSKPAFSGTARDAETSVAQVSGMIYDSTRKLYWNGSAWVASAVYFPFTGKETWGYTLPTLPNGNYIARVLATDTSRNSSTTALGFTVRSGALMITKSTTLSSASAQGQSVVLNFTGALGDNARDFSTWLVNINGQSVTPTAVNVSSETVVLTLPAVLASGNEISVSWPTLQDASGKSVSGSWTGKAD